ncbi:MAG: amidase domain-containing protein [Lachnospiraceae bacterium]|nr:amidase domain-containing protein [Ruminococcus sp.]MCM1274559.1 amidase domain-containing protein [Lachnospiraceae bacterium]
MKRIYIFAVLTAILLLAGCDLRNETRNDSSAIDIPPIISKIVSSSESNPGESGTSSAGSSESNPGGSGTSSAGSSESNPGGSGTSSAESSSGTESSESLEPTDSSVSEAASSVRDASEWSERTYRAELFVSERVRGRAEPLEGSAVTRIYETGESVSVVAFTSTHYFKLSSGDYIFAEYLSAQRVYSSAETVKTELTYDPPARTAGRTVYDPKKALDYAKEHWRDEESLCAGFGSECLTAGGLDFDETSSTRLFNQLTASGLGYAVAVDLNEDGTAVVPDFVYPGDIIFYYCKDENKMVHTAVYNGDTKDGVMKAYAHNLPDGGEEPFRYFRYCVGGCGCVLDKIVAFCFYRDDTSVKLPTGTPKLSYESVGKKARISWAPDFVYRSSELVVTDNKGKIIDRIQMGTDCSVDLELSGGNYAVYAIFTVYGDIKVRSDNLVIKI